MGTSDGNGFGDFVFFTYGGLGYGDGDKDGGGCLWPPQRGDGPVTSNDDPNPGADMKKVGYGEWD